VPNGLSEAEYKAQKKAEATQKAQNKLKYPKGKAFVNVKDYLLDLAAKQKFKGDSYTSTGHAYVKTKYDWTGSKKAGEVDVIDPKINTIGAGSNKLMPPKMGAKAKKSSGGYSFKNPFSKDIADSPALQGFVSNYVPAATQRTPTSLNGYVPNGLSEAEYKAQKKAEATQKAQNKLKYPKGKAFVNVKDYLLDLAAKQKFKGDSYTSTGHAYVKTKYDWTGSKKAKDVDVIDSKIETIGVGTNKLMPPKMGGQKSAGRPKGLGNPRAAAPKKSSGGYSFKNPFSKFVLPAVSNAKHGHGPDVLSSHHNSPTEYSPATDEQQAVQKLLANASNMPMTLSAIGVALLSLATMLGARKWRASSGVLGSDMSVAMAPASGDNTMELKAQSETTPMPAENVNGAGWGSARREFMSTVAGAAGAAVATPALADVDYAGLPYLGGSNKIDINNANVRVYVKLPGMYPGAAGKICSNGPYKSVSDLYSIKGISEAEKSAIKKYESRLIVLEPSAMYVIDRLNNGLYR